MRVVIAGGTGQIGSILRREYLDRGYAVTVLTRNPKQTGDVFWDAKSLGPWQGQLESCDLVINLAGRSVNCRYSDENLDAMMKSRVDSTKAIGAAISLCKIPPRVWLQMSTATIYAHRFDEANDEQSGRLGGGEPGAPKYWDFSVQIAKEWERALQEADTPKTRKVALRSAMVMSPDPGGVFRVLVDLTLKGLGGAIGGGDQYVSWIHEKDFVRALDFILDSNVSGSINVTAPSPLPQREFMGILQKQTGTPFGLPATRWMAEIGAWFLQTDTELILKSRRVYPKLLLDRGFVFQFSEWDSAAKALIQESGLYMVNRPIFFGLAGFLTTWIGLLIVGVYSESILVSDITWKSLALFLGSLAVFLFAAFWSCKIFSKRIYRVQSFPSAFLMSLVSSLFVVYFGSILFFALLIVFQWIAGGEFGHLFDSGSDLLALLLSPAIYGIFSLIYASPAIVFFSLAMAKDASLKIKSS